MNTKTHPPKGFANQVPGENKEIRQPASRSYVVVGLEAVSDKEGRLFGNVLRTFYRTSDFDGCQFWRNLHGGLITAAEVAQACADELLNRAEAASASLLVKREFPHLSGVSVRRVALGKGSVPLRSYPDDGEYSQWDLKDYDDELGFSLGAFADHDLWNVLRCEPLAQIQVEGRLESTRCCLCTGQITVKSGLCVQFSEAKFQQEGPVPTPFSGPLCEACSKKHAPDVLERLLLKA